MPPSHTCRLLSCLAMIAVQLLVSYPALVPAALALTPAFFLHRNLMLAEREQARTAPHRACTAPAPRRTAPAPHLHRTAHRIAHNHLSARSFAFAHGCTERSPRDTGRADLRAAPGLVAALLPTVRHAPTPADSGGGA